MAKMANSERLLLVEGESDKNFFEKFCKLLALDTLVKVAPPEEAMEEYNTEQVELQQVADDKKVSKGYNNKEGVFNLLPIELPQLLDENCQLQRLAVIVDADDEDAGGLGCRRTIERVERIVQPFGFLLAPNSKNNLGGLRFKHADGIGIADFGLWVMPNNQDKGMLEDWIKHCVSQKEQTLFQYATGVVSALPQPKFKPIHRTKAEVATWLAWQDSPGHGLYRALWEKDILIDQDNKWYKGLVGWLQDIYQ